jgi:hypothetical protein
MSDGLGAGFGALMLLAVLVGLALVLALTGAVAVALDRRGSGAPGVTRYVAVALLVGVLAVSGFGVLALYDEAAVLAWVFAALVVVPLSVAGAGLGHRIGRPWIDVGASVAVGWSLPFVAGVVVTFGGLQVASQGLGLASGEVQSMGLPWVAATAGGLVVTAATVATAGRLAEPLAPDSDG